MSRRAGEPGERTRDRHRPDEVLLHVDAAVRRGLRVEADGAHLVPGGRPVEHEIEDDERGERDEEADVQSLELLVAPEDRELRRVGDVVRDRQRLVGGVLQAGRRHRRATSRSRYATQLSMIVEITSWAPTVAFRKPAIPAQIAPARVAPPIARRTCGSAAHPGEVGADPVRDEEADEVLALPADVEHAGAERERDREPAEDERRRLQERLREVVGGGASPCSSSDGRSS